MNEYFRILLNRKWIIILILLTVLNCFLYSEYVKTELNSTPSEVSEAVRDLQNRIRGLSGDEVSEILNRRKEELSARQAASFLVYAHMDDEENVRRYCERYEGFEEILKDVRSGNSLQDVSAQIYAVSYLTETYPYFSGYSQRTDIIRKNAEKLKNSPTYSDSASFAYRNIEKTVLDFERCENIEIQPHTDLYLRFLSGYKLSLVFVFLSVLMSICILKESDERNISVLTYSCAKGRGKFYLSQLISLLAVCVITVLFLRVFLVFYSAYLFCETIEFNTYVQNYMCFEQFTLPLSTAEYLIVSSLYEIAAFFFAGCLFLAVLSLFSNTLTGVSFITLILFIEYLLSGKYGIHDRFYYLSSENIYSLVTFWTYINHYLNFNVLSFPVSAFILSSAVILSGTIILMIVRVRKRPRTEKKKRTLKLIGEIRRFREKNRRIFPLSVSEFRKAWIYEKGIYIPLLLIFLLALIRPYTVPRDSYLQELIEKYRGTVTEETMNRIQKEKEELQARTISSAYTDIENQYLINAYIKLEARYRDLLSFNSEGTVILTDETDMELLYGENGKKYRFLSLLLSLISIALLIPCFVVSEEGMYSLNASVVNGIKKLYSSKQKMVLLTSFIIFVIHTVRNLYFLKRIPEDLSISCLSYEAIGKDIPIYEFFMIILLYRLLGYLIISQILFAADSYLKSYLAAASVNTVIVFAYSAVSGFVFRNGSSFPGTVTLGSEMVKYPIIFFAVMIMILLSLYICSYGLKRNLKK